VGQKIAPFHIRSSFLIFNQFSGACCNVVINKSLAGLKQIGNRNAYDKCEGGNYLEIKQSFAAHAANLFHVLHIGNAQHDSKKYDGPNQHGNHADECFADGLRRWGKAFKQHAHHYTQYNAGNYLEGEVA
jgi:hypothetical protein